MKKLLLAPLRLLGFLFGQFRWSPPSWLIACCTFLKKHLKVTLSLLSLVLIAVGITFYIQSLPKPISAIANFTPILLNSTNNISNSTPSSLSIIFEYDLDSLHEDQVRPEGKPSMARIDLLEKQVKSGITIKPAIAGVWRWESDFYLRFEPEVRWPSNTEYEVHFDKTIFGDDVRLAKSTYRFTSPPFEAYLDSKQFYQDPTDVSIRRVLATVKFSHPVDKESVKKHLTLEMLPEKALNGSGKKHDFSVTFRDNDHTVDIQSTPVTLPQKASYMTVKLDKGIKSILGGKTTQKELIVKEFIPDIYSFLKVSNATTNIVRNEKNEPEQVLTLEFTDPIESKELLNKLNLYSLPTRREPQGRSSWSSPSQVNANVLKNSDKVALKMIPNERSSSNIYNFIIDEAEHTYLYLKIDEKLTSVNKFVQSSFYDKTLTTPRYPKEVSIAGDGSILSASGNNKISISSRGLNDLKITSGRLINTEIHHLISQTSGDINNPIFKGWDFNQNNISDTSVHFSTLEAKHPKKNNYSSFDFSQSLPETSNHFGLFFIKVEGWNKKRKRVEYSVNDTRLVLITDLGIIVKDNKDKSHHVFVQSIANGAPVANASVELLGANGLPIISRTTDNDGQAFFESVEGFSESKQPTVYVVKTANDISFIPFDRPQRRTNLSRFDIGGERHQDSNSDDLNGFLFSDRGIYRPGETTQIGMIVKDTQLFNVDGVPLEIVIYDPRGNEVDAHRFHLGKFGLSDYSFETNTTSPTGEYFASLHLVRDGRSDGKAYRAERIGSTVFSVEEFQPDTLRIKNQLENTVLNGWNNAVKINSITTLTNLFGTPAQDRNILARMSVQPQRFSFKQYKNYVFSETGVDFSQNALRIDKQLESKKSDADGITQYELDLSQFKSGTYRLRMDVEGFEQGGGRSVKAVSSILVSPLEKLVGYKADGKLDFINKDSKRTVNFVVIDNELKKQALDGLQLNRIQIDTVSTLIKQPNGTYSYQSIKKERELSSDDFTIPAEGLELPLDSTEPGDYALEVIDKDGNRLSRLNYSIAGFANLSNKIDKNAELDIKLEKQEYDIGDTINISIKAPYTGAGLITIEQAKVHAYKWFKTDQESSIQSIQLPEGIEGTGYINVSFVRDVNSPEIFTSPLSYAVQPFAVDKRKRRVDIELDTAEVVRPGKTMEIGFRTSKPSKIVVFAIDEGILQVAKYSTPKPLAHYLRKTALEVETQQILDLILPDFDIKKLLSASGGGSGDLSELGSNLNPFARKLDKPAVFWSGIYDANQETQKVGFDVPNTFAGELRVMAVAVSEEAFGSTSTSAVVRGPFVISPNVLNAAAPGDEFDVTVGIANIIDGSGKNADITLNIEASDHLEILDEVTQALKIDEGGENKYTFRVRAKQRLGSAELNFTASYKGNSSIKPESLTRSASLSVRPAMPYYVDFSSGFSERKNLKLGIERQMYPNLARQTVSASLSPLVVVDGLTSYLEHYPNGCTEQVVSKVFPIVGLLSHPAYAPHLPKVDQQFSALIKKLSSRQNSDGGFRFWPSGNTTSVYPSIYALHFLIEANDYGYSVPQNMLTRGKSFLKTVAQRSNTNGSLTDHRNRANAIYLLTRMGEVTSNYLIDLESNLSKAKSKEWKKDIAASYMASTYQLLQKDGEAKRLISGYKLGNKKHKFDDFHNLLALDAQHIYLLSKHFESKARNLDEKLILRLTEQINRGEYNTISSAYAILALGAYSKAHLDKYGEAELEFSAIGKDKNESVLNAMLKPFQSANYSVNTDTLKIASDKPFFYTNVQSGFNSVLPSEPLKQGLEIFREFVDDNNNVITKFEQGQEITVRLKVRSLKEDTLHNIAVVDLLPGGFEVIRSSVSRTAHSWAADYVDIREDRVIYYGSFGRQITELNYKVKLTSSGDFVIPPSFAESMYDRTVRAIAKPGKFEVTESK